MIELMSSALGDTSATNSILVDCTAIKWSSQRKVDNIYGLGGQPRKRGFGNVTYEASITLPYSTQITLREKSSNGTLLGLGEFNIIVSWVNDLSENVSSETVTIAGCLLTDSGFDANQDDTSLTHEFDLHPYRIYTDKVAANANMGWSFELYNK